MSRLGRAGTNEKRVDALLALLANSGGVGPTPPDWQAVPEWFVDAVNGNDSNLGFAVAVSGVTATLTDGSANVLFSVPTPVNTGDILFFSPQTGLGYTVAASSTGLNATLVQTYTGPPGPGATFTRVQPVQHGEVVVTRLGGTPGLTLWLQPVDGTHTDTFRVGSILLACQKTTPVGLAPGLHNESFQLLSIMPIPSFTTLYGVSGTRINAQLAGQHGGDANNLRVPGTAQAPISAQPAGLTANVSLNGVNLGLASDVNPSVGGTTSIPATLAAGLLLATPIALAGTFHVINGSPSVAATADQTAVLKPGDSVEFPAVQAGAIYTVSTVSTSTVVLSANFTGTTTVTAAGEIVYRSSSQRVLLFNTTRNRGVQYLAKFLSGVTGNYHVTVDRPVLNTYPIAQSSTFSTLASIPQDILIDLGNGTLTGTGSGNSAFSGGYNIHVKRLRIDASGGVPTDGGGILCLYDTWQDYSSYQGIRILDLGGVGSQVIGVFYAGTSRCWSRDNIIERLLTAELINLCEQTNVYDGQYASCASFAVQVTGDVVQSKVTARVSGCLVSGVYVSGATQVDINVDSSDGAAAGVLVDTTQGAVSGVTVGGTFARNVSAAVSIGVGALGVRAVNGTSQNNGTGPISNGANGTVMVGWTSLNEPVRFDGILGVDGFTYRGAPAGNGVAIFFQTAGSIINGSNWQLEYTGAASFIEIDQGLVTVDEIHIDLDTSVAAFAFNINSPGQLSIEDATFGGSFAGLCNAFNTTGLVRLGRYVNTSQLGGGANYNGGPYTRGSVALVAGTKTISAPILAEPQDEVSVQLVTPGGTGSQGVYTVTRVAGTSFTITSVNPVTGATIATDTSTVRYVFQ